MLVRDLSPRVSCIRRFFRFALFTIKNTQLRKMLGLLNVTGGRPFFTNAAFSGRGGGWLGLAWTSKIVTGLILCTVVGAGRLRVGIQKASKFYGIVCAVSFLTLSVSPILSADRFVMKWGVFVLKPISSGAKGILLSNVCPRLALAEWLGFSYDSVERNVGFFFAFFMGCLLGRSGRRLLRQRSRLCSRLELPCSSSHRAVTLILVPVFDSFSLHAKQGTYRDDSPATSTPSRED